MFYSGGVHHVTRLGVQYRRRAGTEQAARASQELREGHRELPTNTWLVAIQILYNMSSVIFSYHEKFT